MMRCMPGRGVTFVESVIAPLQYKTCVSGYPVLVYHHLEARRANRTSQRTGQEVPLSRHRCGNKKPYGCRCWLRDTGLPDQEKRVAGKQGAPVQPPGRGQIQQRGIAAKFEQDGGEDANAGSLFRHPQCVHHFRCLANQEAFSGKAKPRCKAWRIGPARLAKDFRGSNP